MIAPARTLPLHRRSDVEYGLSLIGAVEVDRLLCWPSAWSRRSLQPRDRAPCLCGLIARTLGFEITIPQFVSVVTTMYRDDSSLPRSAWSNGVSEERT